jgi:hypothetical protein
MSSPYIHPANRLFIYIQSKWRAGIIRTAPELPKELGSMVVTQSGDFAGKGQLMAVEASISNLEYTSTPVLFCEAAIRF